VLAALAGLIVGTMGLAGAGYLWASARLLDPAPLSYSSVGWSPAEEAVLAVKLAPVAHSLAKGEAKHFSLTFTSDEANRLFQEQLLRAPAMAMSGSLQFGDTAAEISFSRRLFGAKYLNGKLRAAITGGAGDFEVQVFSLCLGRVKCPRPLLPELGHWLEGALETNKFFSREPWRLRGVSHSRKVVTVELETLPKKPSSPR
jgi:hypothetical protein